MRAGESEARFVKSDETMPRVCEISSVWDLCFFDAFDMKVEKRLLRPNASTNVSQQAVPAGPDMA